MSTDIDELKLTAYALGELDAAEVAAVEAHLASAPGALLHVEEVRATAQLLTDELAREDAPGLTDLHLAAIERRLAGEPEPLRITRPARRRPNWALWGSMAASVLIVSTVTATVVVPLLDAGRRGGRPGGTGTGAGTGSGHRGGEPPVAPIIRMPNDPPAGTQHAGPEAPPADTGAWPHVAFPGELPMPGSLAPPVGRGEADFVRVAEHPLSTFPPSPVFPDDAAKGSLATVRRTLDAGYLPPAWAVRTDELINAFAYRYPAPRAGEAFAAAIEAAACPWNPEHRLVRIGLRTADTPAATQTAPAAAARDVTIHVEFNPAVAAGYRLIGYEDRPPGSVGSAAGPEASAIESVAGGQTITAVFEVVPAGKPVPTPASAATRPALKYQAVTPAPAGGGELLSVTVKYRDPASRATRLIEFTGHDTGAAFEAASDDFRTAAAAAAFGMLLRESAYKGTATYDRVADIAGSAGGGDLTTDRHVLVGLARKAKVLSVRE